MNLLQLYNEDCFERFSRLEDGSVDLIVTDPPYAINFTGNTSNTDWDCLTDDQYYDLLCKFLTEAERVLKDSGTIWMCCGRTKIPVVFRAIENYNPSGGLQLNLENWLTYARQKGRGTSTKLKSQAEEILHISKGKKYTWHMVEYLREVVIPYVKDGRPRGWFLDQNDGIRKRWSGVGNVLCFTSPFFKNRFEPQIHSTQKPFLLFTELIMLSSNPGDLVFDPFAGSGCSGVAANCCGRDWMGCEIDPDMYAKANNWIHNYNEELAQEYYKSRIRC